MKPKDEALARWLQNGCQRAAVASVLRKPMIGSEICAAARRLTPKIQLRDVGIILRELGRLRLVTSLNPGRTVGQLYCHTPKGRRLMKVAFDVIIPPVPGTFPWSDYSYVICGRLRRRILQGVQRLNPGNTGDGVDVRNLKRWMADSLPVSANALARVLHELLHRGLVRREARRKTRAFSYWLTETGQEIVTQLDR